MSSNDDSGVRDLYLLSKSASERHSLIDYWFPTTEAGIESIRERGASNALPPLYFLHVWFARRPLTASRAAILATILPPEVDRKRLLKLLGIPPDKDVARAAAMLREAKTRGKRLSENPFTWERAFKHTPSTDELDWLDANLKSFWGERLPIVLDPMAGGGSIPYEATRLGLQAMVGDLNPVAYLILKATIEYPTKFGKKLIPAVKSFCSMIDTNARSELKDYFPELPNETIYRYIWSRTVRCENCSLIIPLSPNWWIKNTSEEKIAARPKPLENGDECSFELVDDPIRHGFDPEQGSDVGKEAKCPRCGKVNSAQYVKLEARAGRMGHQMYAVSIKLKTGRKITWAFRTPRPNEIQAYGQAEKRLINERDRWEKEGLIPTELFPKTYFDTRPVQYGMARWCDFFNPRQLLAHIVYLTKFNDAKKELLKGLTKGTSEYEFAEAVITYGAIVFDTCINYNCLLTRWAPDRVRVKAAMDLQAFPFKTSYAEWTPDTGWEWATSKVVDLSLAELIRLLPSQRQLPKVFCGDAARMSHLPDKTVECIVVDPPYAENVMYGEVMNFFYVWMKRTAGDIFPGTFRGILADTTEEAVANSSSFKDAGTGRAKRLADQHYQSKMQACFAEMNRVLRDDGRLTVMFTHRKVEAWASLATSLMKAGFTFRASWPVFTEPGEKFGKSEKGVLKATILLACQKRTIDKKGLWEEVHRELQAEAESRVRQHDKAGISGPDLIVSTYGPILGKFADYAIVKDATGKVRGPEDALQIVAEVANRFLTADVPSADFETLAYLNLVRSFPYLTTEYDLARLTTVFGGNLSLEALDTKGGRGLVEKKGDKVRILLALERAERGLINPNKPETLRSLIDTVHAALVLHERGGVQSVKNLLVETGRDSSDSGFLGVVRVIAQLGSNGGAAEPLVSESRVANALLEALGQQPETTRKKGESITHYFQGNQKVDDDEESDDSQDEGT